MEMIIGTSSGAVAVTAGTQVMTGSGYLTGVLCNGGSAAGTVTVYDGTSTGGTMLALVTAAVNGSGSVQFAAPVHFNTGLFIVVAGTGSAGIAHFSRG